MDVLRRRGILNEEKKVIILDQHELNQYFFELMTANTNMGFETKQYVKQFTYRTREFAGKRMIDKFTPPR